MPKRNGNPHPHIDDPICFGARVKAAREDRGISQRKLAWPGCSAVYISRIERGERVPSLQIVEELARRLGVARDWLAAGPRTLTPGEAARLVAGVMMLRDDDPGHVVVNTFGRDLPAGMPGDRTGGHGPFPPMRDLAFYAYHGRVRGEDE